MYVDKFNMRSDHVDIGLDEYFIIIINHKVKL